MKTKLCLDKNSYKKKPTKNMAAGISKRIASSQVSLDLTNENELNAFIEKITNNGHTFTPAIYNKEKNGRYNRSNNSWTGQQLFVLDVDNDPDQTTEYCVWQLRIR